MNSQRVVFTSTTLKGTNKKGVLKPDEDGYYTVVLGGLNVYNSAGAYYPLEPAKALFEDSSIFMRRVKNARLKAECGHPKMTPGMNSRSYLQRIMQIEETNVCCHISEVWIDQENVRDDSGRKVVAIMGKIKPSGPKGPALKEALENPKEDVCFSIRSLTDDRIEAGTLIKYIKNILTFDWVTEPGIHYAKKYNSPALEDLSEVSFSYEQILLAKKQQLTNPMYGLESNTISFEEIEKSFCFNVKKQSVPASLNW